MNDEFPEIIRIEPVGRCNYKCIHCTVPTGKDGPNNRQILPKEDFDYRINQFISNGYVPRVVVLHHGGEPLLNENLSYFVKELKKIGVDKVSITTNASILTEKRSKELIQSGLDEIRFSFDGESPEENNYIRINSNFFRDADNVKGFLKIRRELHRENLKVIINNVQIIDWDGVSYFPAKNKNPLYHKVDVPSYITEYFSNELGEIEISSAAAIVFPYLEESENFDIIEYESTKPKYCGRLFETFTILTDGNVALCCNDLKGELILGNIYQKTIFEIWNDNKYDKIRKNFRKQKYCDLCSNCSVVTPRYLSKTKNYKNRIKNV
jgi:radical SAM protein with 4Fe4S-binding SPASM domain